MIFEIDSKSLYGWFLIQYSPFYGYEYMIVYVEVILPTEDDSEKVYFSVVNLEYADVLKNKTSYYPSCREFKKLTKFSSLT